MKRLCALSTAILAFAAGPALAEDGPGQALKATVGAAQVSTTEVAPVAAVNVPVNANAPVRAPGRGKG